MLGWLRLSIAVLLTLVFAVPLAIIAKNRNIRDEPVVMLVLNMLMTTFLYSSMFVFVATADLVTADNIPSLFCLPAVSLGAGLLVAFKLSTLFLAVDQLVAIVFPLHHFTIMIRWVKRMIALTWFCVVIYTSFGVLCYHLGLETTLEFDYRMFGVEHHINQCRWERLSNVYMLLTEVSLLLFSISTCALLVYTAVEGVKYQRRIAQGDITGQTQHFVVRFKSFQRIVKVLLTLLVIDILGTGFRIGSRWFLQSPLLLLVYYLRIICLIIECWTYGMNHTIVRTAIKKFFGFRQNQVHPDENLEDQLPVRQSQSIPQPE